MSSAKTIQILLGFSISESVACICGLGKKLYEWDSLYFSFSSCPFFFPLLSPHLSLLLISCCKSPLKSHHFFHICHLFYFIYLFIYFFVSNISVILSLSCSTLLVLSLSHTSHHKAHLLPSHPVNLFLSLFLFLCFSVSPATHLYLSLPRPLYLCLKISVLISSSIKLFLGELMCQGKWAILTSNI